MKKETAEKAAVGFTAVLLSALATISLIFAIFVSMFGLADVGSILFLTSILCFIGSKLAVRSYKKTAAKQKECSGEQEDQEKEDYSMK